jgi:hypothetical protein
MDFWFEFINIHMNEKVITYHDGHGLKWKIINIYPILTIFLCCLMPFMARSIVIKPSEYKRSSKWEKNHFPCCPFKMNLVTFKKFISYVI